jgi:hypothetical protein
MVETDRSIRAHRAATPSGRDFVRVVIDPRDAPSATC